VAQGTSTSQRAEFRTMKTFGLYFHSARGDWQARYRTRVEPSPNFPRGVAVVHIAFAPTFGDAAVARNEWFARVFGVEQSSGERTGGLLIAWNLRARRNKLSRRELLEKLLIGSTAQPLTNVEPPVSLADEVNDVLRALGEGAP
jgi:hypothetical protein